MGGRSPGHRSNFLFYNRKKLAKSKKNKIRSVKKGSKKVKALVIFDSTYGNTKIIAETVAKELGENAKAIAVSDFNENELQNVDLVIAGSPIIGWKPTENMGNFLSNLQNGQLKGIKAAAFDTRVKIFISGDAAKKISGKLKEAGADIISKPQLFYVKGSEGPLLDGEIEKAKQWAASLKNI